MQGVYRYMWACMYMSLCIFVVIQSLSHVRLFAIPWTASCQASMYFTVSQSLLKFMSIESVMPSNHFIYYHPVLLLPSIFLSIRVFSSESALHIRWPKYWSFTFSISPSNECSWLISFKIDWFSKLMSLLFNMLSRFVIAFLPRSKCLLISWLQSLSAVILEPMKVKSVTVDTFPPAICHEVMGL